MKRASGLAPKVREPYADPTRAAGERAAKTRDIYLAGYSSSGDRNFLARLDGTGEGIYNSQTIQMLTTDITPTFSVANDSVTEAFMPTTITKSTWDVVPHSFIQTVDCGNTLLAVEPLSIAHDYRVVPQPSSGRFTIHHPAAADGIWKLTALDGSIVAQGGITAGATAIQEQGLPAGLYWMELQREDHMTYLRVSIGKWLIVFRGQRKSTRTEGRCCGQRFWGLTLERGGAGVSFAFFMISAPLKVADNVLCMVRIPKGMHYTPCCG